MCIKFDTFQILLQGILHKGATDQEGFVPHLSLRFGNCQELCVSGIRTDRVDGKPCFGTSWPLSGIVVNDI